MKTERIELDARQLVLDQELNEMVAEYHRALLVKARNNGEFLTALMVNALTMANSICSNAGELAVVRALCEGLMAKVMSSRLDQLRSDLPTPTVAANTTVH